MQYSAQPAMREQAKPGRKARNNEYTSRTLHSDKHWAIILS
jgi:hypothetical protein